MRRLARFVATFVLIVAGADALPREEVHVSFVPWKVVSPGESVDAPLVLYWIPASAEELRRSPLLTSEELTLFSARCVAMRIVRMDDAGRLASLEAGPDLPTAILAGPDGEAIARADATDVAEVERMVRRALEAREQHAEERLDEARRRAQADDAARAREIYETVAHERCLCPRQARDAQRALRKMKRIED